MGRVIEYHDEIDSTNIRAKKWAKENGKEGNVVLAEYQSAGKGRLGREWLSPKGNGIWMSIILKPQLETNKIPQLTLVAGFCMCKAIRSITGLDAKIKWPNDIIVNNKKVCGVLTEMNINAQGIQNVVVGVGVNVNNERLDHRLPHATSLALESGKNYDREAIIEEFLTVFEEHYEKYKEKKDLSFFLEAYKAYCVNLNKEIKILKENKEYIAYAEEIGTDGTLIVKNLEGNRETIFTGEVSVRGLYGYV